EDPDTNTGAIGIVLDDVSLGLALMKDPLSTKSYYALKASGTIHLVRLPGDLLSLTIQSLTVEVNGSRDSASPTATVPVVDFLASFGPNGLSIPTGGPAVQINFDRALLRAAGQLSNITLGTFVTGSGHFAFSRRAVDVDLDGGGVDLTGASLLT